MRGTAIGSSCDNSQMQTPSYWPYPALSGNERIKIAKRLVMSMTRNATRIDMGVLTAYTQLDTAGYCLTVAIMVRPHELAVRVL